MAEALPIKVKDEESEAAWKHLAEAVDALTLGWVTSGVIYKRTHVSRWTWLIDVPGQMMKHWEDTYVANRKLGPLCLTVKSLEPWRSDNTILWRMKCQWTMTGGR